MALPKLSVAATAAGASGEVDGILEPDPMCMLMVVFVSLQASRNGYQCLLASWIDGSPRLGGISLKHTACTPRSAFRRTSSAAS